MEQKNICHKIKSKYILKRILYNLSEYKLLLLIRKNKTLLNILNKSIYNYEEILKTEIEIIPKKDKYGYFINFYNNASYYHIYFNDNKEEIKRNNLSEKDNVSKIKVIIDYSAKTLFGLFQELDCIEKINFIKFHRKDITNMSNMFNNCIELKELNVSNLKTNKVKDMCNMFYGCSERYEMDVC